MSPLLVRRLETLGAAVETLRGRTACPIVDQAAVGAPHGTDRHVRCLTSGPPAVRRARDQCNGRRERPHSGQRTVR